MIVFWVIALVSPVTWSETLEDYPEARETIQTFYPKLTSSVTKETEEAFALFLGNMYRQNPDVNQRQRILASVLRRLKQQSTIDVPWYNSHDVSHSLRVMIWIQKLIQGSAYFQRVIARRYGLETHNNKDDVALFGADILALLHDVGYGEFKSDLSTPKFVHAQLGAQIFRKEFWGALASYMPLNFSNKSSILVDMYFSILHHNADDVHHHSLTRDITEKSIISVSRFEADYFGLTRIYQPASVEQDPLLCLLRFADNLDMTAERLHRHQNSDLYLYLLNSLNSLDSPPITPRGSVQWVNFLREHYLELLKSLPERLKDPYILEAKLLKSGLESGLMPVFPDGNLSSMTIALLYGQPNDFYHVYSNHLVKMIDLSFNKKRIYLNVFFQNDPFEVPQRVRNFQINRMADSLFSCRTSE